MIFLLPSLLGILIVLSRSTAGDSNQKENSTLVFVQAVLRHGEKAPLHVYKNDPNDPHIWPEGLEKLTRFGKKHQYAVGKFLRSMYDGFLTTDPKEVRVNSSSIDRCLRGGAVTVAALYEPDWMWKFEDDLNWQPIPVLYLPQHEDKYLNAESSCPRAVQERGRLLGSEEMQELTRKHQKMLEDVSNFIEEDVSKDALVLYLFDTLLIEKSYNLSVPTLLENYFEAIEELADATFKCFFGSDLLRRLLYGSLLGEISENMKRKINGDTPDLKFQLFSVQDVHVAAILQSLNFGNVPRPPNCAMLLFELHVMADDAAAVRMLYMNSTPPLTGMEAPHVLVLDECSEFCPLANFSQMFRHLIPDDWEQECQLNAQSVKYSESVQILVSVFAIIVVICFISLFGIYCYSKRKIEEEEGKCLRKVTVNMAKNVT